MGNSQALASLAQKNMQCLRGDTKCFNIVMHNLIAEWPAYPNSQGQQCLVKYAIGNTVQDLSI